MSSVIQRQLATKYDWEEVKKKLAQPDSQELVSQSCTVL